MGEEGVLHGHHGDDPAQQDHRGIDLAGSHGRGPAPGQADGQDHDADHRGREPEEDAGVAEGPVHRRRSAPRWRCTDPAVIAWSRWVR